MPSVSDLLGNAGALPTFSHHGKEYRISHLTQRKKAEFEQWLRRRFLGILPDLREALPPEEYQEEKRRLIHELASGDFSFHGEISAAELQKPAGSIALAAILFGCSEEEMLGIVAERGEEVRVLLDMVITASMPRARASQGGGEGNVPAAG